MRWRNGLCRPEARELLKSAPTPAKAARLTRAQIQAALRRAGRKRGIEAEADRLRDIFRGDYAHQLPLVENALGKQMLALVVQLEAACTAADDLAKAVEETFPQHPDAEVLMSFPGLGVQLGARVLAEIGDDHTRFVDARSLKAYAGASPITRASGRKSSIPPPLDQERPPQPRRISLGVLRDHRLTRSQGSLPAPPGRPW